MLQHQHKAISHTMLRNNHCQVRNTEAKAITNEAKELISGDGQRWPFIHTTGLSMPLPLGVGAKLQGDIALHLISLKKKSTSQMAAHFPWLKKSWLWPQPERDSSLTITRPSTRKSPNPPTHPQWLVTGDSPLQANEPSGRWKLTSVSRTHNPILGRWQWPAGRVCARSRVQTVSTRHRLGLVGSLSLSPSAQVHVWCLAVAYCT